MENWVMLSSRYITIPDRDPIENENIIDKPRRGAFQNSDSVLCYIKGVKVLIIYAVTTHVSVTTHNNVWLVQLANSRTAKEKKLHNTAAQMVKS
jgi:hypothetical protein